MTRDSGLTSALCGRRVALLVTGSIAAYKAVVLMRLLMKEGARVRVAMTKEASRFVGEAAFSAFLNEPVLTDMWSRAGEPHIELGEWAEVMVVAPATATTIAKMASGVGDNVVVASFLAASGVVFVAPAMHHRMWLHPATQRNVRRLKSWGIHVIEPVEGELANGQRGIGRMAEPEAIVARLVSHFRGQKKDLAGCRVLVSAGPTEEPIDPVRVLTNRSSGKMGWVLAERARERGAEVILVAGPVALRPPEGVRCIEVRSALEMENAIRAHWQSVDAVVMAAAVSDWRPSQVHSSKIKRGDRECLVLELVPNPDILAGLGRERQGRRPVLVGFALESENLVEHALNKLERKKVDLIVANPTSALGGDENEAIFLTREGAKEIGRLSKGELADRIWDEVRRLLGESP